MLFLSALVGGAAALFILGPLLGWGAAPAFDPEGEAEDARTGLLERRSQVLASIKDLEMEFAVGKLTLEDFEEAKAELSREAVEIYRRMEQDGGV